MIPSPFDYLRMVIESSSQTLAFDNFLSPASLHKLRVVHLALRASFPYFMRMLSFSLSCSHHKIVWLLILITLFLRLDLSILIKLFLKFDIILFIFSLLSQFTSAVVFHLNSQLLPILVLHFLLIHLLLRVGLVQTTLEVSGKRNLVVQVQSFSWLVIARN